jgi:hypothetical protein
MASDPGELTPKGEAPRRARRGVRRRHLDVATAMPDAGVQEVDAPAAEAPEEKARPKTKTARGEGVRALILGNLRLVLALVLLIAGILLVILGWYGAANTNILTEQVPYLISGGLLGMALIIVAGVVGSSAGLERDNRQLRRDLMQAIEAAPGRPVVAGTPVAQRSLDGHVYIVPGGRSFHVAGCPIIEGKDGSEMTQPEAVAAGFTVCKLCGTD